MANKTILAIGLCLVLSLAFITFSNWVTTPNKNNPYFIYGTNENRNDLIHVIDNKKVEVPIFFEIGQESSEVSLTFSGEYSEMTGLSMSDKAVTVVDGKAVSKVIILFNSNTTLKAGTHFLSVMASDAATGRILRKGEIRFSYNMHELIGKCSC